MNNDAVFHPVSTNLNWLCRLPKAYLALFNLPDNQSQNFKDYYYSYDVGPVHFTVLNTMWDELHGLNDGIITEQIEWLKKDTCDWISQVSFLFNLSGVQGKFHRESFLHQTGNRTDTDIY